MLENCKVLIVDDSPSWQSFVREVLLVLGNEHPEVCGNIHDAIELIRSGDYGLIILDMNFPDDSWETLVIDIYARDISIPVLIFSGYVESYKQDVLKYINGRLVIRSLSKGASFFELYQAIMDVYNLHNFFTNMPKLKEQITELEARLGKQPVNI